VTSAVKLYNFRDWSATMQAYQIKNGFGLEHLQRVDLPTAEPGPGQVAVRVRAVSLNFRDLMIVTGRYNPRMRLPAVPGSDLAGEVAAVGVGVSRFRIGDRVTGTFFPDWIDGPATDANVKAALGDGRAPGSLAEQVILPEQGCVASPASLSDEECATLPCAALTAWTALFEQGTLLPGETVLTLGTGGVSLFTLQFSKLAGARVIVTSSHDAKLERAGALGADVAINYATEPAWDERVRSETAQVGVDHVIELGGAGTLEKSIRAVRRGGTISLIGVLSGMGQVDPLPILMRGVRVQGIFVGSRAMFERMIRAIVQHRLKPVIDRVFPFEQTPQAFEYMARGGHFGKIVIRVG
jgi:NADPH:quinone reductase-like Zn-dependent oxidoreductase